MARLRFPGRPGYRFGRLGVRYGFDEPKQGSDPSTILIANIHRGLRYFHELFGESDEVKLPSFLHQIPSAEIALNQMRLITTKYMAFKSHL